MSNLTTVINLATGEELSFSLPIRPALIAAFEQAKGNAKTWTYPKPKDVKFHEGKRTLGLGDFCAKLEAPTRVVFRRYEKSGEVIALFPDVDEGRMHCSGYAHVGQHFAADYSCVIANTKPATEQEYLDLFFELRDVVGYELRVVKRR